MSVDRGHPSVLLIGCCLVLLGSGPARPQTERLPVPGANLERQLTSGEIHRYALPRGRDGELWLVVLQNGVDLVVSIVGADGEPRLTVDSPGGLWGEEWLRVSGGESVGETIEIRVPAPSSARGRYRLSTESRPRALSPDRRALAELAVTEAGRLNHEGTPESRRRALEHYRQALAHWQALEQPIEAARTLFVLGMLHRRLDEPSEALTLLRRALADWRHLGAKSGEAQVLMEIASTARMVGENEHVEAAYRQALDLWRDIESLQGQALTLNYLGLIQARSAPHRALESYGRALELFRQTSDVLQEGVVLNNIGGMHDLLGEPHQALKHFRRALDVHRRLSNRRQQGAVWNNIASVHRRTGRLQEALEGYGRSLEIRRELGDQRGEGRALNNFGLTYLSLGDFARARAHLRQALTARRQTHDRRGEAITLYNLGLVDSKERRWESALGYYTQALALRRDLADRGGVTAALVAMGRAEGELGKTASALRNLEAALTVLEASGNRWQEGVAWGVLGHVLTLSGQPEEGIRALERSLELLRSIGDAVKESETLMALGRAEADLARSKPTSIAPLLDAWRHSLEAVDLLEQQRADVDSLGLRTSFLSHHGHAFELAVDLAMELDRREPAAGWAAKALETSERARARSLLDLLEESGAGVRRGVDAGLLARQQEQLERLNARVARRRRHLERQGPSAESERLTGEANEVLAQLEEVENTIRRQSPGWDALVRPQPIAASAIQALLDPETMLLEYSLGEERSFLWAVTRDRIESFELPARALIETAARDAYEGLRIHDPRALRADAEAGHRLSEMLLRPVASRLTEQRLAIVADGALHYLPFAVLPHPAASAEPLLARHEIVSLPSASTLAVQRQTLAGRPMAGKALAVFADPVFGAPDPRLSPSGAQAGADSGPGTAITLAGRDPAYRDARSGDARLDRLLWSRWEAEAIAAHASDEQTLVALGFDADLAAVRAGRLKGYRVVHFATHGIVESEHPELSALVLSLYDEKGRPREGFLRLPEIYNLDLGAELVVLSGCRTALGPEIRGEGLVGLTRGFFAAGARRLMASLWRVQDRSAAELMDRFYRRLMRGGGQMRPAAALREAQLELMSEPEFRDPYHWAAFAIYGDWR